MESMTNITDQSHNSGADTLSTNKPPRNVDELINILRDMVWEKAVFDVRADHCTINCVVQYCGDVFVIKASTATTPEFKEHVRKTLDKIQNDEVWQANCRREHGIEDGLDTTWYTIYVDLRNNADPSNINKVVTMYNEDWKDLKDRSAFREIVITKHKQIQEKNELERKELEKKLEERKKEEEAKLAEKKKLKYRELEEKEAKLKEFLDSFNDNVLKDVELPSKDKIRFVFKYEGEIFMINCSNSDSKEERRNVRKVLAEVKDSEELQAKLFNEHKLEPYTQLYAIHVDLRDTRNLPVNPNITTNVFIMYNNEWMDVSKDRFLDKVREKNVAVQRYLNSKK